MLITEIKETVREGSINIEGPDNTNPAIKFRYKPNAYTPELEQSTREQRKSDYAADVYIALLLPVLDWVDIQDENGDIKVTEDSLKRLPISVLEALIGGVNDAMDVGKKKKPTSGGSFQAQ